MKFFEIWMKHAIINLGCLVGDVRRSDYGNAIECFLHILVPPQIDHSAETCESIYNDTWSGIMAIATKEM